MTQFETSSVAFLDLVNFNNLISIKSNMRKSPEK